MATADIKFANLLGKGVSEIRTIINAFNSGIDETDRFIKLANTIEAIDFVDDGKQIVVSGSRKNIVGSPDGRSASGIMYRSKRSNEIYKKIPIQSRYEIDEFFLEAFIAVVLSTHPRVGENICVPTRAFRSMGTVHESVRISDLSASARPGAFKERSLYLLMDVIPYNYKSWMLRLPAGISIVEHYTPIIRQVAETLAALEEWNFCHNDLHNENFLITEGGQVKLIDFGRSSVEFNRNYYGNKRDSFLTWPSSQFSCDMLTFLVSMYTASGNAELRAFIKSFFVHPVDGLNLLDMIQVIGDSQPADSEGRPVPLHWLCYPYEVWGYGAKYQDPNNPLGDLGWSDTLKKRLRETPNCCRPANLARVLATGPFTPLRARARARAPVNEERLPLIEEKSCWECIKNGFMSMCCGTRRRKGGRRHKSKRTTRRKTTKSRS
jgi:serine/threonine protein kinase